MKNHLKPIQLIKNDDLCEKNMCDSYASNQFTSLSSIFFWGEKTEVSDVVLSKNTITS